MDMFAFADYSSVFEIMLKKSEKNPIGYLV